MSKKPKIVMVCDVKGWGGWERGLKIKEYLSDEFDFELLLEVEDEDRILESVDKVDLLYPLFHTMLRRVCSAPYLEERKIVSMITGRSVLKRIFSDGLDDVNLQKKVFGELSSKCTAIFANNKFALRELRSLYKGPSFYVPRGVNPNVFRPTGPLPEGPIIASYVGKPVPEKGLEEFIRPACKKTGIGLVVNTRNWTNALSLDEMRELYNSCHFHIVSSTIDGTPNPALEAAACRRLIISNPIGNMPDFIKDGVNGFLVKRNVDSYVEAINKIKNDMKRIEEMGRKARESILEWWTWEKNMKFERIALRESVKISRGMKK